MELKVVFVAIDKPDPPPVNLSFPVNQEETAFDVLVAAQNCPCYNFEYKNYTGYGAFITSMCNVANDEINSNYWMFYVNGQEASVGVSNYTVQPNDELEMRYMNVASNRNKLVGFFLSFPFFLNTL